MLKAFREFAMRGNALDMAVGVILGASFGGIVKSLVDDIIMPPVGLLLGGVDFSDIFVTLRAGNLPGPYPTLAAAKQAGAVTLNAGVFINTVISFIIIALAVFLLVRGGQHPSYTHGGTACGKTQGLPTLLRQGGCACQTLPALHLAPA